MSMMEAAIHIKPFGFDRIFRLADMEPATVGDAGESEADVETIRTLRADIARLVKEHEAELARARADGFDAGLWQARNERDTALLAAVDALHGSLDDIEARLAASEQALTRDAAQVALSAAEALAGHAIATDPALAMDEALGRVLRQVRRGTLIAIRVHPTLVEEIERRVAVRQAGDRRKLSIGILPDDTVSPGDARILWEEGGLTVDAEARQAAVLAELAPLINGIEKEKESGPAIIA
jgi:flagellar assembly protein FliH